MGGSINQAATPFSCSARAIERVLAAALRLVVPSCLGEKSEGRDSDATLMLQPHRYPIDTKWCALCGSTEDDVHPLFFDVLFPEFS